MNYDAGEAAISTLIQALTGYSSTNVRRGDWSNLNKGNSENNVVIIQHQPSTGIMNTMGGGKQYTHYTRIELYRLINANTYGTAYTGHLAEVETVVNQLEKYRHLNDSTVCTDADIVEVSEPQRKWMNDGGPYFIATDIIVAWEEWFDITYSD